MGDAPAPPTADGTVKLDFDFQGCYTLGASSQADIPVQVLRPLPGSDFGDKHIILELRGGKLVLTLLGRKGIYINRRLLCGRLRINTKPQHPPASPSPDAVKLERTKPHTWELRDGDALLMPMCVIELVVRSVYLIDAAANRPRTVYLHKRPLDQSLVALPHSIFPYRGLCWNWTPRDDELLVNTDAPNGLVLPARGQDQLARRVANMPVKSPFRLAAERHITNRVLSAFTCSLCMEPLACTVSLSCGHLFCLLCIDAVSDSRAYSVASARGEQMGVVLPPGVVGRCPRCNIRLRNVNYTHVPNIDEVVEEIVASPFTTQSARLSHDERLQKGLVRLVERRREIAAWMFRQSLVVQQQAAGKRARVLFVSPPPQQPPQRRARSDSSTGSRQPPPPTAGEEEEEEVQLDIDAVAPPPPPPPRGGSGERTVSDSEVLLCLSPTIIREHEEAPLSSPRESYYENGSVPSSSSSGYAGGGGGGIVVPSPLAFGTPRPSYAATPASFESPWDWEGLF